LPGLFTWLYFYHRQAGVLIDELALPTYERALSAADHWLFGDDLSLIFQGVYSPALTELIQWAYSLFYVMLLGLPIALLAQRRVAEAREVLGTVALAHIVLVAVNMLVPARWPVLLYQDPALADLIVYPFAMEGLWATDWLRASIAGGTRMLWDSMPSGHTCMTILLVLMTRRMLPRLLWGLVPLSAGLIFGTVYLRYHYGVDVLAGAALALALNVASPRLQRFWRLRGIVGSDVD
jgi:membrane-associated phospholipid phosphatase